MDNNEKITTIPASINTKRNETTTENATVKENIEPMTDKADLDTLFKKIAHLASAKKASDIHLSGGKKPHVRVGGLIESLDVVPALSNKEIISMISPYISDYHKQKFRNKLQVDFSLQIQDASRYRANMYKTSTGVSVALREIGVKIKEMKELNLPPIVEKLANLSKGMVLVTGPTGSGKSTTLSSIIDYINTKFKKHIITIEDPIEFIYQSKNSMIHQRELGRDVVTFADALRGALREDPNVILVGEMRDKETIQLALTAAETGHLVFGTLHTSSSTETLDRIIDTFSGTEKDYVKSMLSTSLQAIIAQRLLPKIGGRGRVAAFEILIANDSVRNMIRKGQNPQIKSSMQIYSKEGMLTLEDSVKKLLEEQKITQDTADYILNKLD